MTVELHIKVSGLHKSTKPYRVATLACVELTRALRRDYEHIHDPAEIVVSVKRAEVELSPGFQLASIR